MSFYSFAAWIKVKNRGFSNIYFYLEIIPATLSLLCFKNARILRGISVLCSVVRFIELRFREKYGLSYNTAVVAFCARVKHTFLLPKNIALKTWPASPKCGACCIKCDHSLLCCLTYKRKSLTVTYTYNSYDSF